MPGAFDFNDFREQGDDFGFNPGLPSYPKPQAPPAPDPYAPPPPPRPSPVQVDPYTGQTVIRQRAPMVINPADIPVESNQDPGAIPMCPFCGTKMHKAGSRPSGRRRRLQAYQCPSCSYLTTKKLPSMQSDMVD